MSDNQIETSAQTVTVARFVGYARASVADPDNLAQLTALRRYGVAKNHFYADRLSRVYRTRSGWKACLEALRAGDILVVESIDRLGRDLIEVVQTVKTLDDRGIGLVVIRTALDSRTAIGKRLFDTIAEMAEWERDLAAERTLASLAVSRERAKFKGMRSAIGDAKVREAMQRIVAGENGKAVAAEYGVSRQTIYGRTLKMRRQGDG